MGEPNAGSPCDWLDVIELEHLAVLSGKLLDKVVYS
jgi:hypothetical protein